MQQPPDFQHANNSFSLVCKLHKGISGMKQARSAWFDRLYKFPTSAGFFSSKASTSLFLIFIKTSTTFILVYVDDILVRGSSTEEIQTLVTQLNATFSRKDLGDFTYYMKVKLITLPLICISLRQNISQISLRNQRWIKLNLYPLQRSATSPSPVNMGHLFLILNNIEVQWVLYDI